jgi:hypothetical protein
LFKTEIIVLNLLDQIHNTKIKNRLEIPAQYKEKPPESIDPEGFFVAGTGLEPVTFGL